MRPGKVTVPEGTKGDVEVRRFTVTGRELASLRYLMEGRATKPGEYTMLLRDGHLWMSDTDAEWYDHVKAYWAMGRLGGRVLINGLGLGMIVQAALELPDVTHIDVVEIDQDVADLVGPHYEGPRCTIHVGDAMAMKWKPGTRWSVAWHDIWSDASFDNESDMQYLHRSYGHRVDWQGSWSREWMERMR